MVLEKNLPVGSGLGSSACSVVAALEGLNAFHGAPLNEHDLLLLMGEMEGKISGSVHYDNVAPCYLGGMQLVLEEHGVISQGIPVFEQWWVVCYPGTVVSTAAARAILPAQYRRQDCLTYGRRLAAFVHASYTGQEGLAASVLKDVIAEPYRAALIEGFAEVRAQAAQNGALATGISGSGPSVFVVMKDLAQAERMKDGWTHISCRTKMDLPGLQTRHGRGTGNRKRAMNLYNIKDKSEQVSFAQAVRQGLGREQVCSSPSGSSRWPTSMPCWICRW